MAYTGTIKSFGQDKGFGFIICDDPSVQGDIFFLKTSLPQHVMNMPNAHAALKDSQCQFDLTDPQPNGKLHAVNIRVDGAGGQLVGNVKTYVPAKGYGFIQSDSYPGQDLKFSKQDLPFQLQGQPLQGQQVYFEASQGPQGMIATQLTFPQLGGSSPRHGNFGGVNVGGSFVGGMARMVGGMVSNFSNPVQRYGGGVMQNSMFNNGGGMGGMNGGMGGMGMGGMNRGMVAPMGGAMGVHSMNGFSQGMAQGGPQDGDAMHGTVKSYDAGKGFGFITCQKLPGQDVYFKDADGTLNPQQGMSVCFFLKNQQGKWASRGVVPALAEGQSLMGTVKSYSSTKGFGFIVVPDYPGDIYFKKDYVPPHLQEASLSGMTVQFTVGLKPDGQPQMQSGNFMDQPPAGYVAPPMQQKRTVGATALGGAMHTMQDFGGPQKRMRSDGGFGGNQWQNPMQQQFRGGGFQGQKGSAMMPGKGKGQQQQRQDGGFHTGVVKSYNPNKGFGFIQASNVNEDIFFKGSYPDGLQGQTVQFGMNVTPDGKYQAYSITPV